MMRADHFGNLADRDSPVGFILVEFVGRRTDEAGLEQFSLTVGSEQERAVGIN